MSPEQKVALKQLAAAAGQNVSAYVLSRALPEVRGEVLRALDELRGGDSRGALVTLVRVLPGLERGELEAALAAPSVAAMTPLARNQLAALVEELAAARGNEPPAWAATVLPLDRPHFRWPLTSLRSYQLRATRTVCKRRNIFDSHAPTFRGLPTVDPAGPPDLLSLAAHVNALELDVEFYFIGNAMMSQAFPARPRSARPRDLFGVGTERDPLSSFAASRGWTEGWFADTAREVAGRRGPPGPFLAVPSLAVFQPPPEYALAMKLASLRSEPLARDLDDLRLLLRSLDIASAAGAHASVSHYVADRHLPAHSKDTLRNLLGR